MSKKGMTFTKYTPEFKAEAVRLYEEENLGYRPVARLLGVKSDSQIRKWVAQSRSGQPFEDQRGKSPSPKKGFTKTKFKTIEEELEYVKAERDYLKKQYPNLHGEVCRKKNGSK